MSVASAWQVRAAAREASGGRCQCDGLCARQHTGPCPNVEGGLAAGSRYPVRLRLVDGRELCQGCCKPLRPGQVPRKRILLATAEGPLNPTPVRRPRAPYMRPPTSPVYGTRKANAVLTDKAVLEIRLNPHVRGRAWAQKFGVSESAISLVRTGRKWRHVRVTPTLKTNPTRYPIIT